MILELDCSPYIVTKFLMRGNRNVAETKHNSES